MAITSIALTISGRAPADAASVEYAGTALPLDSDGRFQFTATVPAEARAIGLTIIGQDGRRRSRSLLLRRFDAYAGAPA